MQVRNMSFDPMAAATDWLDAYRSSDLTAMLKMYSGDAVIECHCGGSKTITGKKGLRAYWKQRLEESPASDLDDVKSIANGASISYVTRDGVVGASLEFDGTGRIAFLRCGPFHMKDYQASIEKLRKDASEAALIRDLATDRAKRDIFDRLHDHLNRLADEVEQAMKSGTTDPQD
jgi:hypothetical protein